MVFSHEYFGDIRTTIIDDEVWFVGTDITNKLRYKKASNAIRYHVDSEDKMKDNICYSVGENRQSRKVLLINESGLYSLIFNSKLPEAKKFKRWITSDVLPSLRRNGGYMVDQEDMSSEEIMAKALKMANNIIGEKDVEIAEKEEKIEKLQPQAEYFHYFVNEGENTNLRNTAKELEMQQNQFINWLIENRFCYRDIYGRILPYAQFCHNPANKRHKFFKMKDWKNEKTGKSGQQTMVTPQGKKYFADLVRKERITELKAELADHYSMQY